MSSVQSPPANTDATLRQTVLASANAGGGWGYYGGKASRLEPTCWSLLALSAAGALGQASAVHTEFLGRVQRSSGWLVEDPAWPVNIGFNGLAAFVWFSVPGVASDAARTRLVNALVGSKGVQATNDAHAGQDNALQGWSWIDATFSWVEPTSWGLIALKKARRAGVTTSASKARIDEAERLLLDRVCRPGGWNFGNAAVLNQDLRPYVPTTALGLLAMQDRAREPGVVKSLDFLEQHWGEEISAPSLGLSLIALDRFGRRANAVAARLREHLADAQAFGNVAGLALALFALSTHGDLPGTKGAAYDAFWL